MPPTMEAIETAAAGIDFDCDGLRRYRLRLSDAGAQPVDLPFAVIRNGTGPMVLVAGGTHGDEFEGQIAVANLLRGTDPAAVSGLLIVLPLHNFAACLAGTRTGSDGADLNRLFRLDIAGDGPSATIARFVATVLLPRVDWVIDLHSGGRAHEFVPSANLQATPGSSEYAAMLPALLAFGAPYAIVFDEVDGPGMPHTGTLEGLARMLGKRAISSELGGGGRATPGSLAIAASGLRNLLAYIGSRDDPAAAIPAPIPSKLIALTRPEHYVTAPVAGRLAPLRWLGDEVHAGELLALLHPAGDPFAEPLPVAAASDGVVAAVASQGLQSAGASLYFIAEPLARID